MAMRLCDQDRRTITDKKDVDGERLRKSLALYLRNWKKGYCGGRRERIISMLESKLMEDMILGHASFCKECAPVVEKYEEQGLKKSTDIKDQWRAYIDNMMDRRMGIVYKRNFDIHGVGLGILLDPDADERRVLEILELYIESHRDRLFQYKERASGGTDHKTKLRALFLVKRKELLAVLNEDMQQNGWNWKLKEERVERLLYRLEHEAAKIYKKQLGIFELLTMDDSKKFAEAAVTILDEYLSVKKDESHEFHRMQLIIHMKEELKSELLKEVRAYRKNNSGECHESAQEAVDWIDAVFEEVYTKVYTRNQEQFRRALQGGGDNNDAVQEIFRGFLRRFKWIDIYDRGASKELAFGHADSPILVDAWEVFSNLFMTITSSVKKFENVKKVEGDMVRYGFDPKQESEWIERMLLICYWDVDRQLKNFETALMKENDPNKKISWDALELNDDEEEEHAVHLSGSERATAIADYSMADEAEYIKRQYSVLVHAKTLIQCALNMNKKPYRVMPFVFYMWILPFEQHHNVDDILIGYIKTKEGKKKESEAGAKGYARTSYNQIIWNTYSEQELLNMRMDLVDKLNEMFRLSGFSGTFTREDYRVLDQRLELWPFTDEEKYMIIPMKNHGDGEEAAAVKYVIGETCGKPANENPGAAYRQLLMEVISAPRSISQNIHQEKYSTKIDKESRTSRPVFDWDQILKDVMKVIKEGQAEVFYGR